MTVVDPRFGPALARLKRERGISGRALAAAANVAESYVSELANGRKMPSPEIAEALDRALDAGGDLAAIVVGDGCSTQLVSVPQERITPDIIAAFDGLLSMYRNLDDKLGSQAMLPAALAQLATVTTPVRTCIGDVRKSLLVTAANHAQFVGWLYTSTGQWEQAKSQFATAMEWAAEADDHDVHATAMSYQGHVSWLIGEPANTVGKALAALRDERVYPGQRAYDAFQAARGYAALGRSAEADRMVDVADRLVEESNTFTGVLPPCQYYRAPWFWQLERGLTLFHLSTLKPSASAAALADLRAGLDDMPAGMRCADWAAEYMAYAGSAAMRVGDFDRAEALLAEAGTVVRQTSSRRVGELVKVRERRLAQLRA